jgi:hypothetical protein
MGPLDLLNHLLNFLAPALAVGTLLSLSAPLFIKNRPLAPARIAQAAINGIAGAAALFAGLWFFGHDGKMASYGAMVLACATSQWVLLRGWR